MGEGGRDGGREGETVRVRKRERERERGKGQGERQDMRHESDKRHRRDEEATERRASSKD